MKLKRLIIFKSINCGFCIIYIHLLACALSSFGEENDDSEEHAWDPNGYVLFCLCMGRVGNQIEHLLGGMAFAKSLNRTLVLPPFRTYVGSNRNVPFDEWFRFEPMKDFHRVILADDFMKTLALEHWPQGSRYGFCYGLPGSANTDCKMKDGNPFGPFWDGLGVEFDGSISYKLSYSSNDVPRWNELYPPDEYPVLAMKGAPAPFPMDPGNWHLQKYLVFSDEVENEANKYIMKHFQNKSFIGLHLRNGPDWENACSGAEGTNSYMASPQCLHGKDKTITKNMCLPSEAEVLRVTKNLVVTHRIKVIFVATDKNPMLEDLKNHLSNKYVEVYHADPWLPLVDWAILVKSDYFVGNCVSSFTSFVKRARDVQSKPNLFWGLS